MNRADAFFQTMVLVLSRAQHPVQRLVDVLAEGGDLPEEAIGTENPCRAAQQFVEWRLLGGVPARKPKWLLDWEEGQRDRVVIAVNPAAEQSEWWMHAESVLFAWREDSDKLPFPENLAPLVAGRVRAVETTREGALLFKSWVERIPGFEQEPFYYKGLEP